MHVVLVGDHPMPGEDLDGGVQRVVHTLRRALARRVRVTLVVPMADRDERVTSPEGDCIFLGRSRIPGALSYWSLASQRAGREIARLAPDVIHVQGAGGYTLAWPRGTWGAPVVFTVHGIHHKDVLIVGSPGWLREHSAKMRSRIVKLIEKSARARAEDIIIINDYVMEELPDIATHPHHNIANPVDRIFLDGEIRPRKPVGVIEATTIGSVGQRKNMVDAIEVIGKLNESGRPANLTLVGPVSDQAYYDECLARVASRGLTGHVTFAGALPPPGIVATLDRTDLLLVTSMQETAPMVIAEAQCRGVPVAVRRAFGMTSMVDEGRDGIFLDARSHAANAAKIAAFLDAGQDRQAIAARARSTYDIDMIAARTIAVYQGAIDRRSAGSL